MANRMRTSALLLCLGIASIGSARAADPGWYVVGFGGEASASGLSQSQGDENLVSIFDSIGLEAVINDSTLDDSDTGFGLLGGYQINDNFAIEFGYVDLGSVDYRAATTVTDGVETADADVGLESSAAGAVVSVLGMLPIGERFSVFARAGLSLMSADGTARITIDDVTQRASQSSQKSDPVYGAGMEYSFGRYSAVRLEWSRYADVGTRDVTGDIDADLISLGVRLGVGWFR